MSAKRIPTAGVPLTTKRVDELCVGELVAHGDEFARVVEVERLGLGVQIRVVVKRRYKRIETIELARDTVRVKARF